ncbi:hypothetical protein IKS57_01915 [bacterium]|nr:hypothetical protein [bacterium]
MWNYVDEQLKEYQRKHKTNDKELEYRIQNVFNMGFKFETLYNYANNTILRQFKTRIRLFKEKYTKNNYVSYLVNKYENRTRIQNSEILRIMLMMEYAEVYEKNYENQLAMFDEIAQNITKVTNIEVKPKLPLRKRFKSKPFVYEHIFLLHILAMPNNLGVTWDEHTASIIDYNAEQCYKQAVIDLREDKLRVHNDLIENQTKREINYKPASNNIFSGQIDNEIAFVINEMKRQVYEYYGVTKVRVKGILDEKTCEICEQYIGNIYDINDIVIGKQVGSHINCRCYIEAWSVK